MDNACLVRAAGKKELLVSRVIIRSGVAYRAHSLGTYILSYQEAINTNSIVWYRLSDLQLTSA